LVDYNGCVRRYAGVLFAALFVYNLNLRPIPSGDTSPAALLPFTIVGSHTITFDRFAHWYIDSEHMKPVWFQRRHGHYYSSFPIALPLLLTPLYTPFLAFWNIDQMPVDQVVLVARVMEKVVASLIATVSVGTFLVLAERLTNRRTALLVTAVYAFGSPTWSTSSQALWQHGASELLIIGGLLCVVVGSESPERAPAVLAGLCAGLSVAIRLTNAMFLAILAVHVVRSRWSGARKVVFASCAALPVGAVLGYNIQIFGTPAGSYPSGWLLQGNLLAGLAGLLISPSRGLLLFCPVFLFSAIGVYLWIRGPHTLHREIYSICLVATVAQMLLIARSRLWYGGFCYGPRLLTDVMPCLAILLLPALCRVENSRMWKFAFAASLIWSVLVQGIGAFCYPNGHWDALPQPVDARHERLWDWQDNQIWRTARAGPVLLPFRLAGRLVMHPGRVGEVFRGQDAKVW
jgi:hypothetical protein